MFHPSLLLSFLLFLDGHFETTPDYDRTDFDIHDILPNFPDVKAEVKRTPHEELSSYLAEFLPPTGDGMVSSTFCRGRTQSEEKEEVLHAERFPERLLVRSCPTDPSLLSGGHASRYATFGS